MHILAGTLDDLVRRTLEAIERGGYHINPGRGPASELTGVLLELSDPLARISATETRGKVFSALGELCWYLSKRSDLAFMTYYVPSYNEHVEVREGNVTGAYGPRLFNRDGLNQMANALQLLRNKPDSRKAVLVVLDANDLSGGHTEVPCTCTIQMLLRDSRLGMFVTMRSNDVHLGLVHDVFAFTMLQEISARTLGVDVGVYKHFVGSLHLYDADRKSAEAFLKEGWQSSLSMPPIPHGDPWASIELLLEAEKQLREGHCFDPEHYSTLDPYWRDLIRLLQVFRYKKDRSIEGIRSVARDFHFEVYRSLAYGVLESMDEETQNERWI